MQNDDRSPLQSTYGANNIDPIRPRNPRGSFEIDLRCVTKQKYCIQLFTGPQHDVFTIINRFRTK